MSNDAAYDDLVLVAGPVHIEPLIELRIDITNEVAGLYVQGSPKVSELTAAVGKARDYGFEVVWAENGFDLDMLENEEDHTTYLMKEVK